MEAADADIKTIVAITEGIPVLDMVKAKAFLKDKPGSVLIGPNCPGDDHAGRVQDRHHAGLHPPAGEGPKEQEDGRHHQPQRHADVRSGLAVRDARHRARRPPSASAATRIKGLNFIELLDLFNKDAATESIILIGEIGGADESNAAAWAKQNVKKPMVAFIAGRTAPPENAWATPAPSLAAAKIPPTRRSPR
jgi:succinyl-CoA synthetase alpha subunit